MINGCKAPCSPPQASPHTPAPGLSGVFPQLSPCGIPVKQFQAGRGCQPWGWRSIQPLCMYTHQTHAGTRAHRCTRAHAHTHMGTHAHVCSCTPHTHMGTHVLMHTHHTRARGCTRARAHSHMGTHAHVCSCTLTTHGHAGAHVLMHTTHGHMGAAKPMSPSY